MSLLVIRGYPGNFRAPQPICIHPNEPFISFAPQMAGDMQIAHEKTSRSEYRFVTFDGIPDEQLLDHIWNDDATP